MEENENKPNQMNKKRRKKNFMLKLTGNKTGNEMGNRMETEKLSEKEWEKKAGHLLNNYNFSNKEIVATFPFNY